MPLLYSRILVLPIPSFQHTFPAFVIPVTVPVHSGEILQERRRFAMGHFERRLDGLDVRELEFQRRAPMEYELVYLDESHVQRQ